MAMKQIGSSYIQHPVEDSWDAIVIGSGIGGLAAAALLAKHGGKRVLVLERHYTAGGFTHTFHRPGYEWDVGVHYIGQVNDPRSEVRAMFDHLSEGRLEWNPMPDVYDRIRIADRTYDFPTGTERFRERMKGYFPEESEGIDKYMAAVDRAVRASGVYFAEKAVPAPVARLAGSMMRARFLRWAGQTTAEVLRQFTGNQELMGVLTGQWGDYGMPPRQSSFGMHAIVAHHYFEGAAYPVGGASSIAASIAPVIERTGGRIAVSAEVAGIMVDSNRQATGVRMADGREIRAKVVISDAGAQNTFLHLLSPEVSASLGVVLEEMKRIPPSMSHLSLYVGLKRDAGEPEFKAGNLWSFDQPDHDASLARFAADPKAPFPFVFISFPSAKDPAFGQQHPGHSTIEVIAPASYRWFECWADSRWHRRGGDYDEFKQRLAERLREELERQVPATRGRIECAELSTPLSTRHFANYRRGEIYGLSASPERFRARSLGARTPVRNLYLTGQDAVTAGVTGALAGGVITASLVLGRNLMGVVTKPSPQRQRDTKITAGAA